MPKPARNADALPSSGTPARIGRPPGKKPEERARQLEQMDAIVEGIGKGTPLAEICRRDDMPSLASVYRWQEEDADFARRVARAREAGYDIIATDALAIADDGTNDWMESNAPGNDGYRVNGEHIQRSRLRIDTRLKLLACWDPKRYGQKVQAEHSGPDGGPIPFSGITRTVVDPSEQGGT